MIDFFFAVMAAGINSADAGNSGAGSETPAPAIAAIVAPETPTESAEEAAPASPAPTSPTVNIGENVNLGSSVVIGGATLLEGTTEQAVQATAPEPTATAAAPATSGFNMAVVPAGLTADPQEPTGKFTTATEVKPIMQATKGNWVAVREYNGQDLLYVTHIWGWRCGLKAMAISVNGETMQNWPLPDCHMQYSTPNAMLDDDGLPYLTLKLGSVQTIDIQIVYDDLSMDAASFARSNVLIP